MLNSQIQLILKVLIGSTLLSLLIKFSGFWVSNSQIPVNNAGVLAIVLLPTLIMIGLLSWRTWQLKQADHKS